MPWNDKLDGEHLRIAGSKAKKIGILAGPGTGKTSYGLLPRIKRLLEEDGVDAKRVLFLTFSRTAASDFIKQLEGTEGMADVTAKTLHSFCFQLLKRKEVFQYLGRDFDRILLAFEEKLLLRDLPVVFGGMTAKKDLLQQYKNGWAKDPGNMPGTPPGDFELRFSTEVEAWLKRHRAVLIDEVVRLTYSYLSKNPLDECLRRYDHIIVDEYQDLNIVEQKIIDIFGQHADLCVAGDDDQSIYGFRNAFPDGIKHFHGSSDEKITINECHRCPEKVLTIANELICKNPDRAKIPLTCAKKVPGLVTSIQWLTDEDERKGIAQAIANDVITEKYAPSEILVLIQAKKLGQKLRDELINLGIPARSFYQEEPLTNDDSRKAMSYLILAANPDDRTALRYWLGNEKDGSAAVAYDALQKECEATKIGVKDYLLAEGFAATPLAKRFRSLASKARDLKVFLENVREKTPEELVELLLPADNPELKHLRSVAQKYLPVVADAKALRDKILEEMVHTDIELELSGSVAIMSLHKSKGLGCKQVYIASVVDGLIPREMKDSSDEERARQMEEDCRLLYVAITRAKEELIFSSFTQIDVFLAKRCQIKIQAPIRSNGMTMSTARLSPFLADLSSMPPTLVGSEWLRQKLVVQGLPT